MLSFDLTQETQGSGPWNVEFQIIDTKSTEIFRVTGIENPRERVEIPIPKHLLKVGGTFEIDLGVSIRVCYYCMKC